MKKTHSANIGGTVFHIEEDAYELLQDYLQSIHTHFHFYPDVAEIVADIEGRIAEQLLQREGSTQIVRSVDVQRVIAAMGTIEQFDEPDAAAQVPPPRGEPRRLFRDPDEKIIAGVASGLAAYLGVPVLAVRLLMVLLVFFFGTAVVVYLLLWALVPMASTTTEKLQMRGAPLTLASIDRDVRDGIAGISPATRNFASRSVTAAGSLIHLAVTNLVRAVRWGAGLFVVGIASLGVLALTVMLVIALVNAGMVPAMAEFMASFGSQQVAFKVFVYLLAVVPLALIIAAGLRLFWDVRRVNSRGLAALLGVWVVAILATAGIWSNNYPQLQQFWNDYPAKAEARRSVERIETLLATTSPLTQAQSAALLATMTAEHKRRYDEARFSEWQVYDPRARLELASARIAAREESHRRILASAGAYLNAQQLADIERTLAQYVAREQASLEARRERMERAGG